MNILASLRRCFITKPAQDEGDIRTQQISYNGKVDDAEIYMPYGLSANIPADSFCMYVQIGGDNGALVVLPDRSQDRIKDLADGEVALFNPLTKSRTIYRSNGDIEEVVTGENGSKSVTIKKDWTVIVGGDALLEVTGNSTIKAATFDVDSPQSDLGQGGPLIARVGDSVQVTVVGGSSAGVHTGVITSGGVNTSL